MDLKSRYSSYLTEGPECHLGKQIRWLMSAVNAKCMVLTNLLGAPMRSKKMTTNSKCPHRLQKLLWVCLLKRFKLAGKHFLNQSSESLAPFKFSNMYLILSIRNLFFLVIPCQTFCNEHKANPIGPSSQRGTGAANCQIRDR